MSTATSFDAAVLHNNPPARAHMLAILQAALDAVRPQAAVRAQLHRTGDLLTAGATTVDLAACRRIWVLGAGKAGAPMVQAVEAVLGDRIAGGLVVVKEGHGGPARYVELVEAGHPVPTAAALAAGARVLQLAAAASADDLVIVLLSGGGSALLEATGPGAHAAPAAAPEPAPGAISLADLQALTAALLACGAAIGEINCLRKHVSRIKGGQLARAVYPARLLTLVLSDVVGSPLDVIASGPTVPDPTTWHDAWRIVEKYGLHAHLPPAILARLAQGREGLLPDTPKPGDPLFHRAEVIVVGDNRVAALAALRQARSLGYHSLLLSTFLEGEAKEVARVVAGLAREVLASGAPVPSPACLLLGGETTVTLAHPGGAPAGRGGRNQELAVAAAVALDGEAGVTVAAFATDGSDGPTDSAGGLVDGGTVARGAALGWDAAAVLRDHNAYPFLAATGDLLRTGPTQTNVNDLLVVLVTHHEPA
jgi:hydroxypyruvate reductase